MNTMLVWMLISVSSWGNSQGVTTVVGHFKTQQMCEHVRESILAQDQFEARCIQAEIIK